MPASPSGTGDTLRALRSRVTTGLADDAARERLSRRWTSTVAALPVAGLALLVLLYLVWRPAFYSLTREDRLLEWTQVALALVAAGVAVMAGVRALRDRHLLLAGVLALGAAAFLGMAGEEVSWGQRAFALTTPEVLASVNAQQEINLHNITAADGVDLQMLFQGATIAVAVLGVALGSIPHHRWRPRSVVLQRLQPPSFAVPGLAMTVAYWLVVPVLGALSPVVRLQEWAEVCLLLSLSSVMLVAHLRAPGIERSGGRGAAVVVVVSVVITVVLAALTAHHGIVPVNARS